MVDLIKEISEADKRKIIDYILIYGNIAEEKFCGLDEWLGYWNKSKTKLFHLLGNQLQYKFPIKVEKRREDLIEEMSNFIYNEQRDFTQVFCNFFYDMIKLKAENGYFCFVDVTSAFRSSVAYADNKLDDFNYSESITVDGKKRTLKITSGMKIIKAIGKVLEYYNLQKDSLEENYQTDLEMLIEHFERFKIEHSLILNDKYISGTGVISIHPLDFMTMSDTKSWTSCMSWSKGGCYNIGSVELLNSNNVIMCYIENKKPMNFNSYDLSESIKKPNPAESYFYKEHLVYTTERIREGFLKQNDEAFEWADKKFRMFAVVTKDIILSGRNYPYANDEIAKIFIEKIKDLAKENMNWEYEYGLEPYRDMKHMTQYRLEQNHRWIACKDTFKHNILLSTEVMYNDFFGMRSSRDYWCYRNKVKHNVVLSISGKVPCLCCGQVGDPRGEKAYDYDDDAEEYQNTEGFICQTCIEDYASYQDDICVCTYCSVTELRANKENFFIVPKSYISSKRRDTKPTHYVCKPCAEEKAFYKCPCCGDPYLVTSIYRTRGLNVPIKNYYSSLVLNMCDNCYEKFDKDRTLEGYHFNKIKNGWGENLYTCATTISSQEYDDIISKEDSKHPFAKYYLPNQKSIDMTQMLEKV